jgi:hypothetical protein
MREWSIGEMIIDMVNLKNSGKILTPSVKKQKEYGPAWNITLGGKN